MEPIATATRPALHAQPDIPRDDPPLSQLLRELAADGRRLVQDEVHLAKLELRRSARAVAADGALVGAGAVGAVLGVACLVAALVIGLGVLIESYWVSALVVGVLLLAAGALVVVKGLEAVRSAPIAPEGTIETLRDDAAWIGDEVRSMRRDLTGGAG